MFETLELQYLHKLIESKVRDFASPEAFHAIKVKCLGDDGIKSSTKVSGKFPVPISALVGNFAVKVDEFTDGTPPIVRAFNLATDGFVEIAELVQGMLQRLRMLNLLTRVQGQISLHAEVRSYTFTRSGQDFFGCVICDDVEPKCSNSVSTDLNIPDFTAPIAMVVIQYVATLEHKLFFDGIPFFEGQSNRAFRDFGRFSVFVFFKNLVACLELRRTVFPSLFLELGGTDTTTPTTVCRSTNQRNARSRYGYG